MNDLKTLKQAIDSVEIPVDIPEGVTPELANEYVYTPYVDETKLSVAEDIDIRKNADFEFIIGIMVEDEFVTGEAELVQGDTAQIIAEFNPESAEASMTYESSDTSSVTVSNTGLLTVTDKVSASTTTITATCKGKTATLVINVPEESM